MQHSYNAELTSNICPIQWMQINKDLCTNLKKSKYDTAIATNALQLQRKVFW